MQNECPHMDKFFEPFCYKTGDKVVFLSKMWAADVPAAIYIYRYRYIYIYIYMLSRQLGDHVFAFEEVNWWDAVAHGKTEIFRVTPFPPRVSSEFFKTATKEGAGTGHTER